MTVKLPWQNRAGLVTLEAPKRVSLRKAVESSQSWLRRTLNVRLPTNAPALIVAFCDVEFSLLLLIFSSQQRMLGSHLYWIQPFIFSGDGWLRWEWRQLPWKTEEVAPTTQVTIWRTVALRESVWSFVYHLCRCMPVRRFTAYHIRCYVCGSPTTWPLAIIAFPFVAK